LFSKSNFPTESGKRIRSDVDRTTASPAAADRADAHQRGAEFAVLELP
jgi:hypothetical protein